MLPQNTERILQSLPEDALVLDVGGWAAPFNRATHMLDLMPYETRGALVPGGYGPGPERFSEDTWLIRDICDHEPWPYPDDHFDFSLCVTTLEDIRDPIWVCHELSRVSKAGYIEVPTIIAELIYAVEGRGAFLGHEHHRWFCDIDKDASEVVFTHKAHNIHDDWRLRVVPRYVAEMELEDHLQYLFWEGSFSAREQVVIGHYEHERYVRLVRERFNPSPTELRLKELRQRAIDATASLRGSARTAVGRLLERGR